MTTAPVRPIQPASLYRKRARPLIGLPRFGGPALVASLALHFLLGVAMEASPIVTLVHAGLVGVAAGYVVLTRNVTGAAYVAGYAAASEMAWRATDAPIPWESAKYIVVGVLSATLITNIPKRRKAGVPLVYMAVLAPSAVLTVQKVGLGPGRELVVFAVMGSLVLGTCVIFFSQLRATSAEFERILWTILMPITTMGAISALATILNNEDLLYGTGSNFAASGGFGPVQVSSLLGVGSVLAVLIAFREPRGFIQTLAIGFGVWFATQSALTFSRGGLFSAGLTLAIVVLHYIWRPSEMGRAARIIITVTLLGGVFALPRVEELTNGTFYDRFGDVSTSRTDLANQDIALFYNQPLLGVGPGASGLYRPGLRISSHTEFTRLPAEHGIFGLAAVVLLITMAVRPYRMAKGVREKGEKAALLVWPLSQMAYANLRIAAVGLIFGLAALRVVSESLKPRRPTLGQTPTFAHQLDAHRSARANRLYKRVDP